MTEVDLSAFSTVNHPLQRPLLVISGPSGSICCGYVSIDALNRNGDAAAIVSGVLTHQEMLRVPIQAVSEKAKELGVEVGMLGKEALEIFEQPMNQ